MREKRTGAEDGGVTKWWGLGRILPRDVRERIYEPALADLLRAWLGRTERWRLPLWAHVLRTLAGCSRVAVPRLFVVRGRLTTFGRMCCATAVVAALVILVVANLYTGYAATP